MDSKYINSLERVDNLLSDKYDFMYNYGEMKNKNKGNYSTNKGPNITNSNVNSNNSNWYHFGGSNNYYGSSRESSNSSGGGDFWKIVLAIILFFVTAVTFIYKFTKDRIVVLWYTRLESKMRHMLNKFDKTDFKKETKNIKKAYKKWIKCYKTNSKPYFYGKLILWASISFTIYAMFLPNMYFYIGLISIGSTSCYMVWKIGTTMEKDEERLYITFRVLLNKLNFNAKQRYDSFNKSSYSREKLCKQE